MAADDPWALPTGPVALQPATSSDRSTLERLGQLYRYDLSPAYLRLPDEDGRFDFRLLDRFYDGDDPGRAAWLIRVADRLGGFAMIRSVAPDEGGGHSITAFFVLRPLRRGGVGQEAARLLLAERPGRWMIAFQDYNPGAAPFWTGVATRAVGSRWREERRPVAGDGVPDDTILVLDNGARDE